MVLWHAMVLTLSLGRSAGGLRRRLPCYLFSTTMGHQQGSTTMGHQQGCSGGSAGTRDIAVLGGGMAGLAVCRHLQDLAGGAASGVRVTIFDSAAPGQSTGASAVAAGLLHPLSPRGKVIWRGQEGLEATLQLVQDAQAHLGPNEKVLASETILRPGLPGQHQSKFMNASDDDGSRFEWIGQDQVQRLVTVPPTDSQGAVVINGGVVVNTQAYLRGLWAACEEAGAHWRQHTVTSLEDLQDEGFTAVVVAAGGGVLHLPECGELRESSRISFSRGQSLEFPQSRDNPLGAAVLCGEYVVPVADRVICGATHEYDPGLFDEAPDPEIAEQHLRPIAETLHPPLKSTLVQRVTTGLRVHPRRSHLGKLPLAGRLPSASGPPAWILTALGSRGLIHHAYLARCLARAVLADDDAPHIPEEVRLL